MSGKWDGTWLIVSSYSSSIEATLAPNGWDVNEPPNGPLGWCYYSIMDDQVRLAMANFVRGKFMFYIAVRSVK